MYITVSNVIYLFLLNNINAKKTIVSY
jgi:hypothetical protein